MRYEKEIKKIARDFKVSVEIIKGNQFGGLAYPWDDEVVVIYSNNAPKNEVLSILFHEIAHVLCYRHRVYYVYNSIWINDKKTKIAIRHFRKTALNAEIAADLIGERLMKIKYPKLSFVGWYHIKSNQKKFLNRINKLAKKWEKKI